MKRPATRSNDAQRPTLLSTNARSAGGSPSEEDPDQETRLRLLKMIVANERARRNETPSPHAQR